MKKYIILFLGTCLSVGCDYKEDNVFDRSPADRTEEKLNDNKTILEYDGYWLLSCYPEVYRQGMETTNYVHRGIGGYNIILKLKDGKVTASSEFMNTNDEVASYYSYQLTEKMSLSFDTFSEVLHHFRITTAQHPNARGGDIFYDIVKREDNVYTLQGRTSRNLMTLTRFSANREAYLNKVREHIQLFVGKALDPISIAGKTVNLNISPGYRQILFSYQDNGENKKIQQAYMYTDKGIKLYEPVVIEGVTIDELYINEARTALSTPDGTIVSNLVSSPIEITDNAKEIYFNTEYGYVSDGIFSMYEEAKQEISRQQVWYDLLRDPYLYVKNIKGSDSESTAGFAKYISYVSGYTGGVWTFYEVDFQGVPQHPDQVQLVLKGPSNNVAYSEGEYKNNIQYFSPLVKLYRKIAEKGPYTVNSTQYNDYYLLTSIKDSSLWFLLSK